MPQAASLASGAGQSNRGTPQGVGDAGLIASMKNFFTGQKSGNQDPFAAPDPEAPQVIDTNVQALDSFNELVNPQVDPNAKPPTPVDDPFAAVTRENLVKAASNMNFMANVSDEALAKAAAGDPGALRDALNSGMRAVFSEGLVSSSTLLAKRLAHAKANDLTTLVDQRMADREINNTVNQNSLFSHPATHPIRDALTQTIRAKNPTITATNLNRELTTMMKAYASSITGFSSSSEDSTVPGSRARKQVEDAYDF